LAQYNFQIVYCSDRQNTLADVLSHRDQNVTESKARAKKQNLQTILRPEHLDPRIITKLNKIELLPITQNLNLVDELLAANRTSESIQKERNKTLNTTKPNWFIKQGLTTFKGRLLVPQNNNLQTRIIAEVYTQVFIVHSSKRKTQTILIV
jgi:hypothetical protein